MSQSDSGPADFQTVEPEAGRAELRRAAFLKAAREVFLEHGYEAANMAEIVRRAGGSLSTLYSQFGGKKGLFEAMIDARVGQLTTQMEIELAAHAPLREGLTRIGEDFLFKQVQPENLDFFRLMVSQAKKFPELAEGWIKRAPEAVRKSLAGYLEDRANAGEIKLANFDQAASIYFDLLRSRIQFRTLLMPSYAPTDEEVREHVARAVKVFLGGIEALN